MWCLLSCCFLTLSIKAVANLLLFTYLSTAEGVSCIVLRSVSMHVQDYRSLSPSITVFHCVRCQWGSWLGPVSVLVHTFLMQLEISEQFPYLCEICKRENSDINALPSISICSQFHFLRVLIAAIIWNTGRKARFWWEKEGINKLLFPLLSAQSQQDIWRLD